MSELLDSAQFILGALDKTTPGIPNWNMIGVHGEKLARHVLATHREDDAEPVTEEWLRSVGFRRCSLSNVPCYEISKWFERDNERDVPLTLRYWDEKSVSLHQIYDEVRVADSMKTRGAVRRLCESLGITLTENAP